MRFASVCILSINASLHYCHVALPLKPPTTIASQTSEATAELASPSAHKSKLEPKGEGIGFMSRLLTSSPCGVVIATRHSYVPRNLTL